MKFPHIPDQLGEEAWALISSKALTPEEVSSIEERAEAEDFLLGHPPVKLLSIWADRVAEGYPERAEIIGRCATALVPLLPKIREVADAIRAEEEAKNSALKEARKEREQALAAAVEEITDGLDVETFVELASRHGKNLTLSASNIEVRGQAIRIGDEFAGWVIWEAGKFSSVDGASSSALGNGHFSD